MYSRRTTKSKCIIFSVIMVILTHNMLDVSKYNLNTIYIFYVIQRAYTYVNDMQNMNLKMHFPWDELTFYSYIFINAISLFASFCAYLFFYDFNKAGDSYIFVQLKNALLWCPVLHVTGYSTGLPRQCYLSPHEGTYGFSWLPLVFVV